MPEAQIVVVHPRPFVAQVLARGLEACGLPATAAPWDASINRSPAILVVAAERPVEDLPGVIGRHGGDGTRTFVIADSAQWSSRDAAVDSVSFRWSGSVQELADALRRPEHEALPPSRVLPSSSTRSLTDREHEVLALIAQGRTNEAIAASLQISPHTVRTHVGTILSKLGVDTRLQASVVARREGLLDTPGRPGAQVR